MGLNANNGKVMESLEMCKLKRNRKKKRGPNNPIDEQDQKHI